MNSSVGKLGTLKRRQVASLAVQSTCPQRLTSASATIQHDEKMTEHAHLRNNDFTTELISQLVPCGRQVLAVATPLRNTTSPHVEQELVLLQLINRDATYPSNEQRVRGRKTSQTMRQWCHLQSGNARSRSSGSFSKMHNEGANATGRRLRQMLKIGIVELCHASVSHRGRKGNENRDQELSAPHFVSQN